MSSQATAAGDARDTLVLVDGSSYLFRAFHALPALTNSKGQPTGAVHGVLAMLRRLREQFHPRYFAVVFDAKGRTFRDDLYPAYKATRPPMAPELSAQIKPLHDIIEAMGLPMLVIEGVEADDVIGTLARRGARQQLRVIVSTSDKDMAQLVTDDITLVNAADDTALDADGVLRKFGVRPDQIIDYLTLMGDSVDNVPGVPKVGPKTAAKWLSQYETLDELTAHAGEVTGKIGENLREALPNLPLSRRLVTISDDVELPVGPRDLEPRSADRDKLREMYQALEFKTLLRELLSDAEGGTQTSDDAAPPAYETVLTMDAFETWLQRLADAELFVFDTETTSLDYMQARIVGVSFSVKPGEAAYVPFGHEYLGAPQQLSEAQVLGGLKPLLEDPERRKSGHNLKYDRSVLANHGIVLRGIAHDSMLQSYVLDSTATRHDMDSLALKYLGRKTIHFEDVAGKGAKQKTFDQIALEEAGPYAAEDADVSLQLHQCLWPRLQAEPGLEELYTHIEMPLVPVLSRIERTGVMIDGDMLRRQSVELERRMGEIQAEAYQEAGEPFNIGSPKQIQTILFEKLKLPVAARTPKGQASTAESVLAELALDYALPRLILDYRAFSKLKSTYTDRLPESIDAETGRVHTSYHQAVAATGRLSSSDPNLQNIPVRTEEGRRIRRAFIAPPGRVLLAADYSQIELRIMAHLSRDDGLCAAFAAGRDIHRATAAEVFGMRPEDVTDEQRRSAKAINFGLIYGMSAFGLARQLGIERGAAQEYVNLYFKRYPGVKRFMDETRERARERGYVETLFNRRLYVPDIKASNAPRRQYAERTAINAPMQGTAADIIKRAMISVDRWLQDDAVDAAIIMQVHDELVIEANASEVESIRDRLVTLMADAADLSVPLEVQSGIAGNWDAAH